MKYDLAILGSGPGGYVAALRAGQLGLKTVCIEKRALGGTCLNVGCIPSKTLLHATERYYHLLHGAQEEGIESGNPSFNFAQMMRRKASIIEQFRGGIAALLKKQRVETVVGAARLVSPTRVEVVGENGKKELEAAHILLATGSEPISLPFLPFDEERILSSTGALSLSTPPKRLAVIGAGVIGVELGSVYSRLGTEVTFIEFLERICPTFDHSLSQGLLPLLQKQGMEFRLSSKVTGADISSKNITLHIEPGGSIEVDSVLVSIGRRPLTRDLNLESVGITPTSKGFIPVDASFRTSVPTIFAIGDLIDGPMLAHKASEEGACVAELLAGLTPTLDYLSIPSVIYTSPEVASVGLSETDCKKLNLSIRTGQFPFKANSRAKCTGEEEGFVKILAESSSDRLLGVHILGAHASELIGEACLALSKGLTASDIAHATHAHPTLSEALKEAALALHGKALHR